MKKILVLGGASAIAGEVLKILAARGDALFLADKDAEKLKAVAQDLKVRGASACETMALDLNDTARHPGLLKEAVDKLGGLDVLLVSHGFLGDQKTAQEDWGHAAAILQTNFISAASMLTLAALHFEKQKAGAILAISSVAGLRGRKSNYVYGSAFAGKTAFLSGLRGRLDARGVKVTTCILGFVDTPMTAHLPKNFLYAKPAAVARGMVKALDKSKDVVYLPWFWRWIMFIFLHLPERIFKKLNF
jgi:short-subunit dehydrogenase